MQNRAMLILGLALILGVSTVVLLNKYLAQEVTERNEAQMVKITPVIVAAADIKSGTRIQSLMLKTVDWPQESLPEGAYSEIDDLITDKPPIVMSTIKKGEPILKHRLSSYGAKGGLPTRIPEDMRAVTIPVTEVRGVGGFVSPGTFVDVLHTTTVGRKDKRPVTRMILQNVEVLGTDQNSSEDDRDPKIVNAITLLVTPHDGQRVALALSTGDVSLLLRNEFDASLIDSEVASTQNLLTFEKKKTKVSRRIRRKVEVIRGLEITNQSVKEGAPAKASEEKATKTVEEKPAGVKVISSP